MEPSDERLAESDQHPWFLRNAEAKRLQRGKHQGVLRQRPGRRPEQAAHVFCGDEVQSTAPHARSVRDQVLRRLARHLPQQPDQVGWLAAALGLGQQWRGQFIFQTAFNQIILC